MPQGNNVIDLSIVILSWNCKELLLNCLNSVHGKVREIESEIILVDNGSNDGTVQMIEDMFPSICLIKNSVNKGVARARNQAICKSNGRYVLLLDADTEILSENMNELIHYMDLNPDIGILGCSMFNGDDEFYPAARTFPKPIDVIVRRLSHYGLFTDSTVLIKHHLSNQNAEYPMEVDYVIGAFQLIRKESIDRVGLLDEKMFYGFEDADYCARMKKEGYKVQYHPSFSIRHYVQGITKKNLLNRMFFIHIKSYLRFIIKFYFQPYKNAI